MAVLRQWFPDFAAALIQRSGRSDWPEAGTEYWDDFQRALAEIRATSEQADAACSAACNAPGLFIADYRPRIVAEIRRLQAEPAASGGPSAPVPVGLRDCPDCQGSGWAIATRDGRRVVVPCSHPDIARNRPVPEAEARRELARLKDLVRRPPGRPSEASVEARREKLLSTLPEPRPEPPRPVPEPEADPEPVEIPEQRPLPEEIDDPINWW